MSENNPVKWTELINECVEVAFSKTKDDLREQNNYALISEETWSKFREKLDETSNEVLSEEDKEKYGLNLDRFFPLKCFTAEKTQNTEINLLQTEFVKRFIIEIVNTQEYINNADFFFMIEEINSLLKQQNNFSKIINKKEELNDLFNTRDNLFNHILKITHYKISNIIQEKENDLIHNFFLENFMNNTLLMATHIINRNDAHKNVEGLKNLRFKIDKLYYINHINLKDEENEFNTLVKAINTNLEDNEKIDFDSLVNLIKIERFTGKVNEQGKFSEYIKININSKLFNIYMCNENKNPLFNDIEKYWNPLRNHYVKEDSNTRSALGEGILNMSLEGYNFLIDISEQRNSISVDYAKIMETTISDEFKLYLKKCYTSKIKNKTAQSDSVNEYACDFINKINNLLKELNLLDKLEVENSNKKIIPKVKI